MMGAAPTEGGRRTVVHVIDTLLYAGAQQYVALVTKWSDQRRYRHIVCVLQPHTELREQFQSAGVAVVCLNRPRPTIARPGAFLAYVWRNTRDIMQLCRTERADVVHCHLSDAEFLGIAAAALCRTGTIISTVHGPLPLLPPRSRWSARNLLRRIVTMSLYRLTDHIVAVSDEVAREARRLFWVAETKIKTIVNRIDTDRYALLDVPVGLRSSLGLSGEHKVITTVARFAAHKGQSCLIDALHAMRREHPEARLLLVGDGECRRELQAQCARLGIADRVQFAGNRSDIPAILALTDIFAFPSFAEGTSLALLEAMAAAKPIVAADIPGNRALLANGTSSLLVPPGDAPALARALTTLLEHPETARVYAQEARAVARNRFDIRTTVGELEALWRAPSR